MCDLHGNANEPVHCNYNKHFQMSMSNLPVLQKRPVAKGKAFRANGVQILAHLSAFPKVLADP